MGNTQDVVLEKIRKRIEEIIDNTGHGKIEVIICDYKVLDIISATRERIS